MVRMIHSLFYLVKHILDDEERGRVCGAEFPVEGLEAGAVSGRAVGQLPGMTQRPGGKLPTQLGYKHLTQVRRSRSWSAEEQANATKGKSLTQRGCYFKGMSSSIH